jgi:deazaflavin-dependent oxidoreductase (nitroreductase family)
MKKRLIQWFTALNMTLIRLTGGRVGGRLGSQTILLLQTTGRKTGRPHTLPVAYFHHEGNYLLVGSNWGRRRHADWYLNLLREPNGTIEVRGKRITVTAHDADGEEYARLWKFATDRHPPYREYQEMTDRRIPIMVLTPANV